MRGLLVAWLADDISGVLVSRKCDVTNWDDQVALFAAGAKTFGSIDIVLPNAGMCPTPLIYHRGTLAFPFSP